MDEMIEACKKCGSTKVEKSMDMFLRSLPYGVTCATCGKEIHGFATEKAAIRAWNSEVAE